jgi:hypothetical protein
MKRPAVEWRNVVKYRDTNLASRPCPSSAMWRMCNGISYCDHMPIKYVAEVIGVLFPKLPLVRL